MDKNIAREVVRAAFRSGSELENLLGLLKERCSAEDYKIYAQQVARAIDGINAALLNKVVAQFPELEAEIEANIARTGQAMP
jgi:hypothetical protein